ncbi:(d)CMP kinase [Candidatus Soleaferrea massiliensis]|uniref:(d)CMP kinase n=1 Tax=Candidatus Soleaferrea massiliensis TaxID=1470354 RepID=UPI00058FFB8F|nr:(d)CMP kinase [Candidatus Soleaferrea massiliensis]
MKSIAIDGPAGAGKSTIAKGVAKNIGFIYVDTGALYRSIGYFVQLNGKDPKDPEQVVPLLDGIKIELKYENGVQKVYLNGEDVSEKIRTPQLSMYASNVSAIPKVREFLFDLQRNLAKTQNVIMDGRDIGTVVLPDADIKIFLTASVEERARRRYKELAEKDESVRYEDVLEEMKQRDYNDMHRDIAPLRQADDALLVDTTENNLEESIEILTKIVKERL